MFLHHLLSNPKKTPFRQITFPRNLWSWLLSTKEAIPSSLVKGTNGRLCGLLVYQSACWPPGFLSISSTKFSPAPLPYNSLAHRFPFPWHPQPWILLITLLFRWCSVCSVSFCPLFRVYSLCLHLLFPPFPLYSSPTSFLARSSLMAMSSLLLYLSALYFSRCFWVFSLSYL